ncbi:leucine rich repeat variant [Calothrix parasitica NIES-267]|uniref:Leucine rich repeat variant n=1 Tax=Calothrix parasitica NIES-267 TaxID=1973488 RepID=A0A1Z4LIT4_9CYAN|nr:leucine rich repeat variant [Calothrix parasitica NIES-267]
MQSLHRVSAGDLQRYLDAPEELLQESEEMQIAVAAFSETPRSLLQVLVNSDYSEVVEAARLHVNWMDEERGDYREAVSEVLREKDLGENDRLAVELMRFAPVAPEFLSEWVPVKWLTQGLKNEYMPLRYRLQLLERLANQGELEARLQVAESSETPVSLLELLAGDLDLAVRLAVEYNDNCPLNVVELVKSQHDLASDWDTDIRELEDLGESNWGWVRLAVARNPFAGEDVLMKLAGDEEFRVRFAVAKNPGTSAGVLNVLLEGGDSKIRGAIVEHPNATEEILLDLFSTHRNVIQNRNNLSASILERFFRETFTEGTVPWKYKDSYYLLRQPNTPTWILAELANVDIEAIRAERLEQETRNNSTPGISNKWVEDDIRYLKDVATHTQVSEDILTRLAEYPNPKVKLAVAKNHKTSEDLQIGLLEEFINNRNNIIIAVIAEDSNTPVAILERIAQRLSPFNRMIDTLSQFMSASPNNTSNNIENLLSRVQNFISNYQPQEEILSQLRQDNEFRETILQDWNQFLASLSEEETEHLQGISNFILLNFGLGGGIPYGDREWLDSEQSNHILFGLLMFKNFGFQSDKDHRIIAASLICNPNTPLSIRDNLLNQFIESPNNDGYYKNDYDVRMAIAYNPHTSEKQRIEYLQQALSCRHSYIQEKIAKNPLTPISVLEFIAQRRRGGVQDVIKNPHAPVTILRQAAETDNSYTLRLIAENPNTPKDLLFRLLNEKVDGKAYKNSSIFDSVLRNPNLSVLERYQSLLEKEIDENTAQVHEFMARRSDSPYALAQVVENGNQNAKLIAARNRNTPVSILEQLARDSNETLISVLVQNPNLPSDCLIELAQNSKLNVQLAIARLTHPIPIEVLLQFSLHENKLIRSEIARNKNTPSDIVAFLAEDKERDVRIKALINENIPSEVLSQALLTIYDPEEIKYILRGQKNIVTNPLISADVLERLYQYFDDSIRYLVAKYPTASVKTLQRLAFNRDKLVCKTVAENPSTPANLLIELAKRNRVTTNSGCYHSISNAIAMRKDAPSEALEYIVRQSVVPVVYTALRNPNTPVSALEWLLDNHNDEAILGVLAKHPNTTSNILIGLSANESAKVRQAVVSQEQCPVEILENLAFDSVLEVQQTVAANPNTPNPILEIFAQSENTAIRTAVASNPNLSQTTLEQLANDEKIEVRRAVVENSNTPENIRERLRDLILQPNTQPTISTLSSLPRIYNPNNDDLATVLTEYAESDNAFVRFVVLLHPVTPGEILNQGANSVSWLERYAVAENEATSLEILGTLINDGNWVVRAAANQNLSNQN